MRDEAAEAETETEGRKRTWTKTTRETFLDHLAATGDVAASAAKIGKSAAEVYGKRRQDAAFAAGWSEALALGYQLLEMRLVGHALGGSGDGDRSANTDETTALGVRLALDLLKHQRDGGARKPRGDGAQYAQPEDTDRVLLKRLDKMAARRGAPTSATKRPTRRRSGAAAADAVPAGASPAGVADKTEAAA